MPTKVSRQKPVRKKKRTRKKTSKATSVIDRIAPVGLTDAGMTVNVYGRSATGKTTFACTFPKKILIAGSEDGTRSIYNVKGVEYVLMQTPQELLALAEHAPGNYKTFVLDNGTGFQDLVMADILDLDEDDVMNKSWGTCTRDDWAKVTAQMKRYLKAVLRLKDQGVHVVILAHERAFNVDEDSELLEPNVQSAMTPGASGWLAPECDYVVQTYKREEMKQVKRKVGKKTKTREVATGEIEYCLRTGPHPIYLTKFRVPKGTPLPESLVDPSFAKMSKLIGG